jgi:hypothetical protein
VADHPLTTLAGRPQSRLSEYQSANGPSIFDLFGKEVLVVHSLIAKKATSEWYNA